MGRATGAMLGLAIGDALGKRTEFLNLDEIGLLSPDWRRLPLPKKAQVTDDTQMTLALARALRTGLAEGPLVPLRLERPLREEFVDWWRSPDNNRAPGMTCLRSCFRLSTGRPWQDASDIGSKGCGANMRVAPLGLVRELTDRQVSGAAQLQSGLTHGHPTALAASELTAFTVRWLAQGTHPPPAPGGWEVPPLNSPPACVPTPTNSAPTTTSSGSETSPPGTTSARRSSSSRAAGTSA